MKIRRISCVALLITTPLCCTFGDKLSYTNIVKASLEFKEVIDASAHYPNRLHVYLRLKNNHDSQYIAWACDRIWDVDAELIDPKGNQAPSPAGLASIQSGEFIYSLPYGSQLDWMINHGGISMLADSEHSYALIIGGNGWLIPKDKIDSYSLKIVVRGLPWIRSDEDIMTIRDQLTEGRRNKVVLFETPLTPINIKN